MVETKRRYSYCLLTYNQAATVADAVKSALDQDCAPMQILISDDCSKDETFAIIKETVADYCGPHQVILNRNVKNLGLAAHIDLIHSLSSGDVIIAAAGDDLSHPNRSQRIMATFEAENPLLVCSRAIVIDPQGIELSGNFHRALFYREWDLVKAAGSNSLYIGATGAWARELYTRYGAFDPEAYEDLVLGFRAALEGRIAVINEKLVKYRLGNGITSSAEYFNDVATFEAHRSHSFAVASAILKQRWKDAEAFGLERDSKVWQVIRKEKIRARIGLAYYKAEMQSLLRLALRNPLLAVETIYAEQKRGRKMKRKMRQRAEHAVC